MKLFGFQLGSSKPEITSPAPAATSEYSKQSFSTPFGKIGKGDITKPYISSNYKGAKGYVYFGLDNLYPQIIDQMAYTSPLNGSIIMFKKNSVVGGGFEILNGDESGKAKVELHSFLIKNKIKKLWKEVTLDMIMHNRSHILVQKVKGEIKSIKRLAPGKVRLNEDASRVFVCSDWSTNISIKDYPSFSLSNNDEWSVINFLNFDDSPGQDYYPLPIYTSCFNFAFLDGESSLLHKQNIQNSIFPSVIIRRPKAFASEDEFTQFKNDIKTIQGGDGAGTIMVLAANGKEQMPEIESFPTTNNDKLFLQTADRIDSSISVAHSVDSLLLGIRVSGKLGSGTDIKEAYKIYEKNFVMPMREQIEDIMNELMLYSGIKGEFHIKNFQIAGDEIKEVKDNE